MHIDEFLNFYSLNATNIMWFLGAGASRSAGMPSATDIIWDLKRRHYCQQEDRFVSTNDLSNEAVRNKIQSYLEAAGCPPMGDDDEYAYYFEKVLGNDLKLHQNYLAEQLNPEKISINSGHRILAALLELNLSKLIFTTNFDSVLETAFAAVVGKELHNFNLEGSVAALDALNDGRFPIYAKMHGDFRYTRMKNLPKDLKENDEEIEKCFINACSRYGMIVCGYSGRDSNVMAAFDKALDNPNAFPKGLFWITSGHGRVLNSVQHLIAKANAKGINAHIVIADTFDSLLIKIWKALSVSYPEQDARIRRYIKEKPVIPKYFGRAKFPIIRTNAFLVEEMPSTCLSITPRSEIDTSTFMEMLGKSHSPAIAVKGRTILAWGSADDINKIIPECDIQKSNVVDISKYLVDYRTNSTLNSFYNRALARALANGKPIKLRKLRNNFYLVIQTKDSGFSSFEDSMKSALKTWSYTDKKMIPAKYLAGRVPRIADTYYMECAKISLEYFDGKFWLLINPDVWIEPSINREKCVDFLKQLKKARYNQSQAQLLDVWKNILFGEGENATLSAFNADSEYNPTFKIVSKTGYSLRDEQ